MIGRDSSLKRLEGVFFPWSLEGIQLKRQPIVPGMISHLLETKN